MMHRTTHTFGFYVSNSKRLSGPADCLCARSTRPSLMMTGGDVIAKKYMKHIVKSHTNKIERLPGTGTLICMIHPCTPYVHEFIWKCESLCGGCKYQYIATIVMLSFSFSSTKQSRHPILFNLKHSRFLILPNANALITTFSTHLIKIVLNIFPTNKHRYHVCVSIQSPRSIQQIPTCPDNRIHITIDSP